MNLINNLWLAMATFLCFSLIYLLTVGVGVARFTRWARDVIRLRLRRIRHCSFAIMAILLFLTLTVFIPTKVCAQPYYTNTSTQFGPNQYNDKALQQNLITTVRSNQFNSGIISGFWGGTTFTNAVTNILFNHTFAQPPVVYANFTNMPTYNTNAFVTNVTVTNFCVSMTLATNCGGNFIAIGAP